MDTLRSMSKSMKIEVSPVPDVRTSPGSPPADPSGLTAVAQAPASADSPGNLTNASHNASTKCDIFTGNWVADPTGPVYTNVSCRHIQEHQNCLKNGRPDANYLLWRWKPRDCDLPRFDPELFLDRMSNKWLAFVGDSISRNHVQSLICILSQVEEVEEMYHDKEYRSKIWRFPSHNFTLSVIWSPFLLKAETFENTEGVSFSDIQLHLDELDHQWTDQYINFDYVVISGGKWFLKTSIFHENNTITGCHYCQGKNNLTELGYQYSYRKALRLVLNFVAQPNRKAQVLFRTTTPDHFENGEWNSGGFCNRTMPFNESQGEMKSEDESMRSIELEEFRKIQKGSNSDIGLLDTTSMSLLRPDGHPGPYRYPNPFAGLKNKDEHNQNQNQIQVQNDCLHWCLPGPIDSWNDLMVEVMLNREVYR
ncbi:protein trichome birefringence-like 25 isoform X2 [Eutrema salsugineum]|uniref:protein trichome birefringence-like 25 isoform X2 n=1 Tax=Eutrema salsugineum TaxID=72664 RepID=UPI000CECEAE4|nr:protein trichome birefringence-like 25 isoform X2 [Eutrema salsugineum]